MSQKINRLLKKTNLKPKERVLLFVHNAVSEDKEGKSILSETDKLDLVENWRPDNNEQISEYNKYNEGWRTAGFAEFDAQTTNLRAENAYLRLMGILYILIFKDNKKGITKLEDFFSSFDKHNTPEKEK